MLSYDTSLYGALSWEEGPNVNVVFTKGNTNATDSTFKAVIIHL